MKKEKIERERGDESNLPWMLCTELMSLVEIER